jgi:hypothetical protein
LKDQKNVLLFFECDKWCQILCGKEVIFRQIKDSVTKTEVPKALVNSLIYPEFRKLISDTILLEGKSTGKELTKN